MSRFDNRDKNEFKKDIKFGTNIESFWMDIFREEFKLWPDTQFDSIIDNGVDNSGNYVTKSNGNADYLMIHEDKKIPLEVKFAPNKGIITFKIIDIENYIKQSASILLIYNSGNEKLSKPKDYDFERHKKKILEEKEHIRWAILDVTTLEKIHKELPRIKIKYMGNKVGFIIKEKDFSRFFTWRELKTLQNKK